MARKEMQNAETRWGCSAHAVSGLRPLPPFGGTEIFAQAASVAEHEAELVPPSIARLEAERVICLLECSVDALAMRVHHLQPATARSESAFSL